uniref:Tartrate-resistant acid phosphatase type 5 n=1 Tax=Panagrolaimus superbus TaxID=310955 RepID=A0A914YTB7_9BILA
MKVLIISVLYLIVKLVSCGEKLTELQNRLACTSVDGCSTTDNLIDFILIGDTGGLPPPFYTSYAQRKVAESVDKLATEAKAKFILGLGDNFYFNGVRDLDDSRFWRSFEDPYKVPLLPWFVLAGNHDHLGNVTAQILHTNRSNLWTFPRLYYSIKYRFGNPSKTLQIVMIDTIELCGNCIDVEGEDIISWIWHKKLVPDHPANQEVADKQWKWLENELSQSKADYLFVAGHYPIYSVCEHGPNTCLISQLDPLLRKYNVTAYFSGHDHNLQLLRHTNDTDQTSLMYIVSGAGSRSDRSKKHLNAIPEGSLLYSYPKGWNPFSQIGFSNGGFVKVSVGAENGSFSFYSGSLDNHYKQTFYPRRINS